MEQLVSLSGLPAATGSRPGGRRGVGSERNVVVVGVVPFPGRGQDGADRDAAAARGAAPVGDALAAAAGASSSVSFSPLVAGARAGRGRAGRRGLLLLGGLRVGRTFAAIVNFDPLVVRFYFQGEWTRDNKFRIVDLILQRQLFDASLHSVEE